MKTLALAQARAKIEANEEKERKRLDCYHSYGFDWSDHACDPCTSRAECAEQRRNE